MPADRPRLADLAALVLAVDLALLAASVWLYFAPPLVDRSAEEKAAAAYQAYAKSLDDFPIGPAECRSERELDEFDTALARPLAPPRDYAAAWKDTAAVAFYRKWLVDAQLLRRHSRELANEFDEATSRGERLLIESRYDAAWAKRAAGLLARSPTRRTGPVPGSVALLVRRGQTLDFESVYSRDLVQRAEADWSASARRLTGLPAFCELLATIGARINSLPLLLAVLYR